MGQEGPRTGLLDSVCALYLPSVGRRCLDVRTALLCRCGIGSTCEKAPSRTTRFPAKSAGTLFETADLVSTLNYAGSACNPPHPLSVVPG